MQAWAVWPAACGQTAMQSGPGCRIRQSVRDCDQVLRHSEREDQLGAHSEQLGRQTLEEGRRAFPGQQLPHDQEAGLRVVVGTRLRGCEGGGEKGVRGNVRVREGVRGLGLGLGLGCERACERK